MRAHGGEDMRTDRTVGIEDGDRALEERLKAPPYVESLRLRLMKIETG